MATLAVIIGTSATATTAAASAGDVAASLKARNIPITVGTSGQDFATIQEAIDASVAGGLIIVNPEDGPYDAFTVFENGDGEQLDGLTIIGRDFDTDFDPTNPDAPDRKIDAREFVSNERPDCDADPAADGLPLIDLNNGPGCVIRANDVTIEGFRFSNGNAVDSAIDPDITDDGGAIDIFGTGTIIRFVCISDNFADENGGGIAIADGADLLITNSVIRDNEAEFGGGICVSPEASLKVVDVDFIENEARGGDGGAIEASAATLIEIDSSCFIRNEARASGTSGGTGGAIFTFLSVVNIENSEFCENTSFFGGGAINNVDSTFDILFTTFYDNTAFSGGGIEAFGSSSVGSPDSSMYTFRNTAIVFTPVVNSSDMIVDAFVFAHSYIDYDLDEDGVAEDVFTDVPGATDLGGNIDGSVLPAGATSTDLFNDPENCVLSLTRDVSSDDGLTIISNPLIDSGDSSATSLLNCEPPFFLLDPDDAEFLAVYCGKLPFFDKHDNCRAIDVIDIPTTLGIDENIPNTGIDIFLRNCTCEAVDIGAKEFQNSTSVLALEPFTCMGDSDQSGFVDINDLFTTLNNFNKSCF